VTYDEAIDELYGAPLEDFVAERKRLATKLGGDEGKELAKLRKPNVAAWTLNQLARRNRRDVDLLLDAGHRLRQAGLDRTAFERARATQSDALKRLTKATERLLRDTRGSASPSIVAQVNESLRAAAVGEEGRELLARGRFVEPLHGAGFEAYEGMELPKQAPRPRKKPSAPPPKPRVSEAEKEAKAALREAERNLRRATAEVEAARRRLERLQK
jgi:hypothetical protein